MCWHRSTNSRTRTVEACSGGDGGDGGGDGVIIGHVQDFSFLNEERRQEGKPAKLTEKPTMKSDESVEAATVVKAPAAVMTSKEVRTNTHTTSLYVEAPTRRNDARGKGEAAVQQPRTLTPRGWSEPARS
ncbi:hypothetical protein Y032_0016g3096 [Ancylostoma ceylanicum]|uniref:Uncharacterized protein n=1 Tax=Ancylostoma ceylanicum TaxID=53326 RepID=A0A016V8M4_9BILA|nr:hypothetical protein Y032_0016g3096 [Ancylostoma ceylanicum]